MKRILCMVLVIAMFVSVLPVVSMASDETNYNDYVPGEIPANMFKTDAEVKTAGTLGYSQYGYLANINTTGNWVSRDAYNPDGINGKYLKMTAKGTTGELMSGTSQTWYFNTYGLYFGQAVIKSNNYQTGTGNLISGDIAGGKNYVFDIQVKNVNSDYTPSVVIGIFDLDSNARQYSVEYGSDGMVVEGSDWVDFKGTIANKSDGEKAQTVNDVDRLSIGLNKDVTYAGSSVAINYIDDSNGMKSAYFAEEQAYDISNTLIEGSEKVNVGDTLTFEAELINQVGLAGCLDQTFEWLVMDTARENEVSGISIVPSDDTKTAAVTIEDTLVPGSYDIVAYSEKYDMAKGCTVTLEAPYYYYDSGEITIEAKLNSEEEWTTDAVTTGLVNYIDIKATLEDNTEAFEWVITDKNRLSIVEDVFDITPVTNTGAEQTVRVTATTGVDIKPGDYNVVAVAKDGSVKAQPITLDITGDLDVIVDVFATGTADEIKDGLESTYLSVLGLLDSCSSKADKAALAKIINGAAEEEKIADITEVEDVREVLERLAVLSFHNVTPDGVNLITEDGNFVFEKELGINKIDDEKVTLFSLYKTAMTEDGRSNVRSAVIGADFETVSEFILALKESIVINAIANPVVNGAGYVANILTEANLNSASIDSGNYLTSDMKASYHSELAGKTFTIDELEKELAKKYKKDEDDEEDEKDSKPSVSKGGGSFSSSVTVPAVKEEEKVKEEIRFADVSENHWAFKEIVFLGKTNVINGAEDGNFYPEKTITREEALKMICEAFDISVSGAQCNFDDVDQNAWYYKYVASAKEKGIVNGISEREFGIGQNVTRQDICVMIMRAAENGSSEYPENVFTDKDDISDYAKNAVDYLSALFVVNGFTDGSFKPHNQCTKAEISKIIYNCVHILGEI